MIKTVTTGVPGSSGVYTVSETLAEKFMCQIVTAVVKMSGYREMNP